VVATRSPRSLAGGRGGQSLFGNERLPFALFYGTTTTHPDHPRRVVPLERPGRRQDVPLSAKVDPWPSTNPLSITPAKALFANARSSRPRSKARNTGQSTAARPVSSWTKKKTRRPSNLKASEKSGDRTAAHSPRRDHRPAERLGAGERSRSFYAVPGCGGWFDMRDLGWALEHAGPLPHPARDKSQ
jgi:hypothetical protein